MAELATYQALLSGANGDTFEGFIRVNGHIESKDNGSLVVKDEIVTSVRSALSATDDVIPSEKAVRDAVEALSLTGEPVTPFSNTLLGLAPVPTEEGNYWTVLTEEDGVNKAGIYLKSGNVWVFGAELGGNVLERTQAQAVSVSGPDYTAFGLDSTERLDQWGLSRRVQRIFNASASFDFNALGYADKTAVYVRNQDAANGINVTYGAGGANTLEIAHADGMFQTVAGQDSFNLQPSEIVFMEKEGSTIRASIIPAERVVRFDDYAQANGFGAIAHDAIVMIRNTGELFFRRTGANSVVFPLDGEPNADWWKIGGENYVGYGTTAEKNALGVVPSNTPYFDTNLAKMQRYDTTTDAFQVVFATTHQPYSINWPTNSTSGSGINFKVIEDPDAVAGVTSINLPDGTEKQIWIVAQQVVGNTPSVGGAGTLGGTAIVRNDGGIISLVSVPSESRWNNSGSWATLSYNQLPNLVASGIGVTDTEIQRIFSNVVGAGFWINADGTITQGQSLEDFKPLTAYATGDRFVAPMPLNANFIDTNGAIVNVDYIFEANTDIPDTIAAFDEAQADSGNYDLVGVYRVSGTDDRVLSGAGTMLLDPLSSLSNTSVSEYIHWTTTDTPKTIRLVPAPVFVTTWKDYTGNNISQPTAANEDFVLPADSQMWAHRSGNAIQVTFESNEGGSAEGLRKSPVADITALVALTSPKDGTHQTVLSGASASREEYVFYLGRTPIGTDITDVGATGAWVLQDLVVTQQILGSALIEERGIFKEIIDDVSASTTGSVTFPNGGFGSSPKVQTTAETNGHTINVRNITATGFTYDQWDVEDIQQGGNFTYRAIGLK